MNHGSTPVFDALQTPLEPGVTWLEASAGSGKTFALSTLAVRYVLERRTAVRNILVVTFTRAAASELRQRIRRLLAGARSVAGRRIDLRAPPPGEAESMFAAIVDSVGAAASVQALDDALESFDQAPVGTIDSFCQRALQEFAFLTGTPLSSDFTADVAADAEAVTADFWRRLMHSESGSIRAKLAEAARLSPDSLGSLSGLILNRPEINLVPKPSRPRADLEREAAGDPARVGALAAEWSLAVKFEFLTALPPALAARLEASGRMTFLDLRRKLDDALAGPNGSRLAAELRRRFPVALIDEFQDTDPAQWRIFHRLFVGNHAALWLVGDPKQAIYGFRGADLTAYLSARGCADRRFALDTNWRSDSGLVTGVNALFSRAKAPFLRSDLEFTPVRPAVRADQDALVDGDTTGGRLNFWMWAPSPNERNKDPQRRRVALAVAAEIQRLVSTAFFQRGVHRRPVHPRDIAVLVYDRSEADALEAAFSETGLASVRQTRESVFQSEEATDLWRVVQAVLEPGSGAALRGAAASRLLGWTAAKLEPSAVGPEWTALAERFQSYAEIWEAQGPLAWWRAFSTAENAGRRLLRLPRGLRAVTNYQHLAELLDAAATEAALGPRRTSDWFAQKISERQTTQSDEQTLRLDRDDDAVRLVTIHSSKGLEYPIVFCPFLFEAAISQVARAGAPLVHHSPAVPHELAADLRPAKLESGERNPLADWAEGEEFSEALRLTYVALTRARNRCYVTWGPVRRTRGGFERSTLAWLLRPNVQETVALNAVMSRLKESFEEAKDRPSLWRGPVSEICARFPDAVVAEPLPAPDEAPGSGPPGTTQPLLSLTAPVSAVAPPTGWTVVSYSSLLGAHRASDGRERLAEAEPAAAPAPEKPDACGPLDDFRGVEAGNCLHAVFEQLPRIGEDAASLDVLAQAQLSTFGFDDSLTQPLADMVRRVLRQPLPAPGGAVFRLDQLPRNEWRCEAAFHLPLRKIDARGLAAVIHAHGDRGSSGGDPELWAARLATLGFNPAEGFLTGKIDLLVRWGGRIYVFDWKSNHLGHDPGAYGLHSMGRAMSEAEYFLQAHLYTLAVHRHWRLRMPGYEYERDFGGAFYLFTRGVTGEVPTDGAAPGVFPIRPPARLIAALDRQFLADAAGPTHNG